MSDLLTVDNLTVRFEVKRGGGWGKKSYLYAVDDISFAVKKGETLAIVGESGSGKTTAALAVARLVNAHRGSVRLDDEDVRQTQDEDLRAFRQKVQFIFQDPYSSLNPRQRAEAIVREPLDSLSSKSAAEKTQIVEGLFQAVGLRPEQQRLFPHQF
jgi:peptide/nickel transport system ATP-binding protein